MMSKKVSIIIPAYNVESHIEECLKSVCSQSYNNLQIIVVDDGSVDRTAEIIDYYSKSDSRIIALHNKNCGVSFARNIGISIAEGYYITFLDADDSYEPNAIETLVKAIEKNDTDCVSCQYSRWDETGNRLDDFDFIEGNIVFSNDSDRIEFITKEFLDYLVGFEVWDKIYRADSIKDNKIMFPEKISIGEDLIFNIMFMICAKDLQCISQRCVRHKLRNTSAMGQRNNDIYYKVNENNTLLEYLWSSISKSDNNILLDSFLLIYIKLMGKAYIGYTPLEASDAVLCVSNLEFARINYEVLEEKKEDIMSIYPQELSGIVYRYNKYIKGKLCGESISDSFGRRLYNLYRMIRGRESLEKWKMPY